MSITPAMQEYLAEAYRIAYYQGDTPFISTSALSEVLHVSAPAVTRMVQRLREDGYLEHEPYRGIRLTQAGEREALLSIRKHRLIERFLVDVMGFGWHEVHDHADEFGVEISDNVIARMNKLAGYPRRCPHGEPIPTEALVMPRIIDYPLNDVSVREVYRISRVNTHDAEKLRYLGTLGMKPGASIELLERAPFSGPLRVRSNGQEHFLGHELATVLRVCSEEEYALA